jgi:MFS transporter, YNFM family, putative membrane transport protein
VRTLGVIVAGFCAFLQLYATQPILPLLRRVFQAGTVEVSLTVTVAALGVALSAPFVGLLADRLGRKRVIVASAFLLAVCSLLAATSPNLPVLILWRFLQGACTPGVFSVTVAYINDEWAGQGVGAALSAYVSGTVIGGFSCRFIAGMVAARWDWRMSFVVLGVLSLVGATAVAVLLKPEQNSRRSVLPPRQFPSAVAGHLRNKLLLATYLVGFCVLFSLVAVFTYVTFYLSEPPFDLRPDALGSIFFVYLIGAAVNPMAGRAIDKYGARVVLASSIGAGVVGVALTFIPSLWTVGLGLAICSTGVFASQTAASGFVGLAAERHRALAVGLYATFYYLGGSAGAVLPGYFWNWGGWPACAAFIVTVQVVTVGIAIKFWTQPARWPIIDEPSFIAAPEVD